MNPNHFHGTSEDVITGKVAPIGEITGFPKPKIRSAWPTPIGKKLTDNKIARYAKKGWFVTNNAVARAAKQSKTATKRVSKLISDLA